MRLLLLMLMPLGLWAQQLDFCTNYEADGTPLGTDSQWQVGPDGGSLYVVFRGQGKVADGASLTFRITQIDGSFNNQLPVVYKAADGFVVIDYEFTKAGTFKAEMLNNGGTVLASTQVTIRMAELPDAVSSAHFTNAKVGFAESVDNEEAHNVAQVFGISAGGSKIMVFVTNDAPFYTDQLVIDIWQRKDGKFTELVETLLLDISPQDKFISFPYRFTEAGTYRFSFYTRGEKFIQHGYIKTILE